MRLRWLILFTLTLSTIPVCLGLEIAQVGVYDFGVAYDIVYSDDIAYVSGNDGVDVFDVSDRMNPVKLTRIRNDEGAFGLALQDDRLYIAGTGDGLFIVDVSDTRNPVVLGSAGIMATDVCVEDDYAYVASGTSYSIIDVSDPENPVITSTIQDSGRSDHLKVLDDTLYLGETLIGLKVYNVTDKTSPTYLKTVSGTTGIFDIKTDGAKMYLGCHGNGVKVLDVTNRNNPRVIGSFNNGGEAYGVHIIDNYLLVADLQQGIEILDIQNPESPSLLACWTGTHPHGVAGDSQYIYLADQDDGLEIFIYGEGVEGSTQGTNWIPLSTLGIVMGVALVALAKKGSRKLFL